MSATRARVRSKSKAPCLHERAYAVVAMVGNDYYQHGVICACCGEGQGRDYETGIPSPWLPQDDAPDGGRFDILAGPSADVLALHVACVEANNVAAARLFDRELAEALTRKAKPGREQEYRARMTALYEGLKAECRARFAGHLATLERMRASHSVEVSR